MVANQDDVRGVDQVVEFADEPVLQVDSGVIAAARAAHAFRIGLLNEGVVDLQVVTLGDQT